MTTTPAPSIAASLLTGTSTGPFPTGFKYGAAADVRVYLELAGVRQADLSSGSDYTLTGATPLVDGGTVTLSGDLVPDAGWDEEAGDRVVIYRRTVKSQALALPNSEGHKPKATEAALDKQMRALEEMGDQQALTVRVRPGEDGLDLPPVAQRAGRLAAFDDDGNFEPNGRTLVAFDADVAQAAADRLQTGADRVQTGADRVQTGADRIAAIAAAGLAGQFAAAGIVVSGVDTAFRPSVATAMSLPIEAAIQTLKIDHYAPAYTDLLTLTEPLRLVRASLTDLTDYPAAAIHRHDDDRYLPNGTEDATNGGYFVVNGERIATTHFGALGDGATDDVAAVEAAAQTVLAMNSNPSWSNKAVLTDDARHVTYLPGGADLFGVGRIDFQGELKMSAASDILKIGLNSVLGEYVNYQIAQVTSGTVQIVGVMNGDVHIGECTKVELYSDSSVTGEKSIAYSYLHIGGHVDITVNGIDGDGVGGASPYMNSLRWFTKRPKSFTIKAGYPHNMHFVDCMGSDAITVDIEAGHSNWFEDGRWEVTSSFTFDAGTHNNYAINAYYGFADAYFRRVAEALHTVSNAGKSNELFEKLDAHFDQKELWAVHAESGNFNVAQFTRGAVDLTCVGNNQVIFDSGLFPIRNALGFFIEADSEAASFLTPFVYFFDEDAALITADPGSDVISMVNGAWNTSGDPLGLLYHYRTSAPVQKVVPTLFPKAGSGVEYGRIVLRTGGAVSGTKLDSLRVILTEAKKYNTRVPMLRPMVRDSLFSTAGSGATAVPCSAGTFRAGEYVAKATIPGTARTAFGTVGAMERLIGWDRLTDGNAHVIDVDWRQVRARTGG